MGRSRSGSATAKPAPRRQSSSSPMAARAKPSNLPTVQPNKPSAAAASSQQVPAGRRTGEVFKDMAATAAGVAVGSAVGHAVGAGITGAFSGRGNETTAQQPVEQQQQRSSELVEEGPCAFEIKQFLKCTEEHSDLTVCQTFNEAVRECRKRYNL